MATRLTTKLKIPNWVLCKIILRLHWDTNILYFDLLCRCDTEAAGSLPGGILWDHSKETHLHLHWARTGVAYFRSPHYWYWWPEGQHRISQIPVQFYPGRNGQMCVEHQLSVLFFYAAVFLCYSLFLCCCISSTFPFLLIQIQWFWRALRSFDQADRAKFLQFVTGTSKVPLQGFSALEGMNGIQKFQIHRDDRSTDRLPSAHTWYWHFWSYQRDVNDNTVVLDEMWFVVFVFFPIHSFNQLDLPAYESYEKLRHMLLLAIQECSEGFGLA